jgi:hypothetical protein
MFSEEQFSKLLDALKADLLFFVSQLREVSKDIIAEGFSKYPVFVATEHEVSIGELILPKAEYARDFNIYATTMEELVEKKLILANKKQEFTSTYKDPQKFMCVLLLTSATASFIFVPYHIKAENKANDE